MSLPMNASLLAVVRATAVHCTVIQRTASPRPSAYQKFKVLTLAVHEGRR